MDINKITRLLKPELVRFEEQFYRMLNWSPTGLSSHLEALKGKRLRPLLLILIAKAIAPNRALKDSQLNVAVVIELIHNATLIHDDVLDDARLRRNVATFNAGYGNEMAVLFGDYLFSQAFVGCSDIDAQGVLKLLSSVSSQMCLGELRHMHKRFHFDLAETDYFQIIRQKTASLFSAASYLGASLYTGQPTGGPTNRSDKDYLIAARNYGENFGIAYQIMDDYLDIVNIDYQPDKSAGTDLSKGKITLPVIRMLETAPEDKKKRLMSLISQDNCHLPQNRKKLHKLLENSRALDYTRNYIKYFIRHAQLALKPFRKSAYKDALLHLSEQIMPHKGDK
ncbi:MAG: polyprenyl synthetase family protein [Planctomycetota bacterium]